VPPRQPVGRGARRVHLPHGAGLQLTRRRPARRGGPQGGDRPRDEEGPRGREGRGREEGRREEGDLVQPRRRFASAPSTSLGAPRDASPPLPTTSLMRVDERKAYSALGIMKTVSTSGASERLVSAIWYSNSKSLVVRTPRSSTPMPCAFA